MSLNYLNPFELAAKIPSVVISPWNPPKELSEKFRWIQIRIYNKTQFSLSHTGEWFDSGRFWESNPPTDIPPFSHSVVSACCKDGSVMSGTSGAMTYVMNLPNNETENIAIAFSCPFMGSSKTRAQFSNDKRKVWRAMDSGDDSADVVVREERITRAGERVRVEFHVESSIDNRCSSVIISQIVTHL